jgi:hypothetical protein
VTAVIAAAATGRRGELVPAGGVDLPPGQGRGAAGALEAHPVLVFRRSGVGGFGQSGLLPARATSVITARRPAPRRSQCETPRKDLPFFIDKLLPIHLARFYREPGN